MSRRIRICNARAHLSILRRPHSTELHLYSTWVPDVPSGAGSRFKRASITGKSLSFVFCSKPELLKLGTRMTYSYYLPPCLRLVLLRSWDILSTTIALSTNQQFDDPPFAEVGGRDALLFILLAFSSFWALARQPGFQPSGTTRSIVAELNARIGLLCNAGKDHGGRWYPFCPHTYFGIGANVPGDAAGLVA
ncbi:hypothetical protein V8C34DRAFT_88555 [Trichoderma compactum]